MRIAPPIELAVEPGPKARWVPDVFQRDLGGPALPAQSKECLRARTMVNLDPAERVWRSEMDDFDDQLVTVGIAMDRNLVASSLPHLVVPRPLDRHPTLPSNRQS